MTSLKPDPVRLISVIMIWYGLLAIVGWLFDITPFYRPLAGHGGMQLTTACLFVLCGIGIIYMQQLLGRQPDKPQVILPAVILLVFIILFIRMAASLFRVRIGIESIISNDPDKLVGRLTITPLAVIIGIAVFNAVALGLLYGLGRRIKVLAVAGGGLVLVVSCLALLGYLIDNPLLYWRVSQVFSPLSPITAVLLAMLGAGIWLIGRLAGESRT